MAVHEREYAAFVRRRADFVERLAPLDSRINARLLRHDVVDPTLAEIAELEGLLAEQRQELDRLTKFNDDFMNYLVAFRGRSEKADRSPKNQPTTQPERNSAANGNNVQG